MKKILIICMVLMLLALCACRGNVATDPTDPGVSQPTNATEPIENDGTEPTGGGDTGSWETPIDVDDSFNKDDLQEPTSTEAASDPTTPADPTEPEETPTEPSAPAETTKPTTPAPTTPAEPEPTQPTEGSTDDKPVVNPDGSIPLPMIPGK